MVAGPQVAGMQCHPQITQMTQMAICRAACTVIEALHCGYPNLNSSVRSATSVDDPFASLRAVRKSLLKQFLTLEMVSQTLFQRHEFA